MNSERGGDMNVKSLNKFQPQSMKKNNSIEQHTIIRRKTQAKNIGGPTPPFAMNSLNYSSNDFGITPAAKKFF